jgi:signal transduction histidine kinase
MSARILFRGARAVEQQVHGTGLGLSLVRKIVEAHGGSLAVKSEPGAGAEFIVRLPVVARGPDSAPDGDPPPAGHSGAEA